MFIWSPGRLLVFFLFFLLTGGRAFTGSECSHKRHSSVVDEMWVKRTPSDTGGARRRWGLGGPDRHRGIHDHLWSRSVGTAQDRPQQGLIQMLQDRIASTAPRTANMNNLMVWFLPTMPHHSVIFQTQESNYSTQELLCCRL